jgi:hypothetical protein
MERNTGKQGFFVISGRKAGEIEAAFHYYLKKQSQSPASGRKSKALNPKSETRAFGGARFEKTKPISKRPNEHKLLYHKELWKHFRLGAW